MNSAKKEVCPESLEEGRAEGSQEKQLSNLKTIMNKMKRSAQKAMDFLDLSADDQEKYAPLLKEDDSNYQPI